MTLFEFEPRIVRATDFTENTDRILEPQITRTTRIGFRATDDTDDTDGI